MSDAKPSKGGTGCASISRRGVLGAGAAATALPAIAAAKPSELARAAPQAVKPYKVIYDERYAVAVSFACEARAAGYQVHGVGEDPTSLWYDDLYHRWRESPAAIAGLTSPETAFCLQVFAQDVGMRLVFRGEHRPSPDGGIEHRLSGPATVLARAELLDTGAGWGQGLARLMAACPAEVSSRTRRVLHGTPTFGVDHREQLVSWVVAPVRRVRA